MGYNRSLSTVLPEVVHLFYEGLLLNEAGRLAVKLLSPVLELSDETIQQGVFVLIGVKLYFFSANKIDFITVLSKITSHEAIKSLAKEYLKKEGLNEKPAVYYIEKGSGGFLKAM
jgi:hypothetical protein